jgi:protein TonB
MSASRRSSRRHRAAFTALALLLIATASPAARLLAGTAQLQVFFASGFTDQAYQKKAYTKVAQVWKRPAEAPKEGSKSVVIILIQRDGGAPEPVLHLASGSEGWDRAALDAVRKASPFDPLPESYPGPSVEVHWHFEYTR